MAVTYATASSATTTVALPTHAAGDMIVVMARGTAAPTIPAAGGTVPTWTEIGTGGVNNSVGWRVARTIATGASHTSGTWTGAAQLHVLVIRGSAGEAFTLGNVGAQTGANNTQTIVYPALTYSAGHTEAIAVRYGARGTADTEVRTAGGFAAGGTFRTEQPATTPSSAVFTKTITGNEASFSATTAGVNAAYRAGAFEVLVDPASTAHNPGTRADTLTVSDSVDVGLVQLAAVDDTAAVSDRRGATYAQEVLADAPVGYWRLAEPSGTSANDETANNLDGVYQNAPTLGTPGLLAGDTSTAVDLDAASTQFVEVTDPGAGSALDFATAFTLEAWIKPNAWASEVTFVSKQGSYYVRLHGGLQTVQVVRESAGGGGDGQALAPSNAILTGGTYHVVATYDNVVLRIYIDGAQVVETWSSTGSLDQNNNPLRIGSYDGGAQQFDGVVDEVAVYGAALSPARVLAHYTAGTSRSDVETVVAAPIERSIDDTLTVWDSESAYAAEVLADAPALYLRLGELSGTVADDLSGNNLDGTYQNTPGLGAAGLVAGGVDAAVDFDAASVELVEVADTAASPLDLTTEFSLEAWIKPNAWASEMTFIGKQSAYYLRLHGGLQTVQLVRESAGGSGDGQVLAPTDAILASNTYHVVGTYDGSALRIYIDGSLAATSGPSAGAVDTNDYPVRVASYDGFTQQFDGVIDEAAVYPVALSATRVAAHYAAGLVADVGDVEIVTSKGAALADPVAIADTPTPAADTQRAVADPLGFADTPTTARGIASALADPVGLADLAASESARAQTFADPVGIADNRALALAGLLADPLGATDLATPAAVALRALADSAGIADLADPALTIGTVAHERTVDDPLGVADVTLRELAAVRLLADAADVADVASQQRDIAGTVTDPLALADVSALLAILARTLTDSAGVADLTVPDTSKQVALADPLALTDLAATVAVLLRTQADPVGVVDLPALLAVLARAVVDGAGVVDATTPDTSKQVVVPDLLGVADLAATVAVMLRAPADPVALTDARGFDHGRAFADLAGIADLAAPVPTIGAVTVNDPLGMIDAALRELALGRALDDLAGLTDVAAQQRGIAFADPLALADTPIAARAVTVALADSAGIVDLAGGIILVIRPVADPLGIADLTAPVAAFAVPLADPLALADQTATAAVLARAVADPAGIADSPAALIVVLVARADTLTLTDSRALVSSAALAFTDPVALADLAATSSATIRQATDPLNIADLTVREHGRAVALADLLGAADAHGLVRATAVAVDDPLTLADLLAHAGDRAVTLADLLTLADLADVDWSGELVVRPPLKVVAVADGRLGVVAGPGRARLKVVTDGADLPTVRTPDRV